ncbi:MAG: alpha/beta hydrolase [Clostridia bacterium]|nr:alpha/beta hydrolase [Clostridia bacterium]
MSIDLQSVSYLQKGTGKDLVLLHGYLSSKEAFAYQIDYFSRFYRVTAFDFLGQGQSAALELPFSVGDYADWTQEVLSTLNVVRPHVIAHSFGCRVAVKMAGRNGQVFDKLVLTGPAGVILPRGLKYKIRVGAYKLVKRFAPNFAEKHFGSAEYRTLSPVMKESYKKIVNEDLRVQARKVENEVLIVEGTTDTVTPKREAEAYLQSFPQARLVEIAGGHFAFLENPISFNLTVEEFLDYGRFGM